MSALLEHAALPRMEALRLGRCSLTASRLEGLAGPRLRRLELRGDAVGPELARVIGSSPFGDQLEALAIEGLSEAGASSLALAPSLRKLRRLEVHLNSPSTPAMRERFGAALTTP